MWQRIQTYSGDCNYKFNSIAFFAIWVLNDTGGEKHMLYAMHYSAVQNDVPSATYFPDTLTAVFAIASMT